jgi:hypothetical protein
MKTINEIALELKSHFSRLSEINEQAEKLERPTQKKTLQSQIEHHKSLDKINNKQEQIIVNIKTASREYMEIVRNRLGR